MSSIVGCTELWKVYKLDQVEVPALQGVTLSVNEGDFMALMGPSGCGKSTLLHLLGCLDRPTRGLVHLLGCRWSTIRSVVNGSAKMSIHEGCDIETARTS